MFRTLSFFLGRELLRVTSLALGAFTLVMTIFAIIEPLRRRGLGGDQVLALFGYTLPGMISLTLPIAALFAATIVYGRFAQDNELMACRASGIPTLSLLKPALVLGAVVTILSLALNNMVAPRMFHLAEDAVTRNVPGIMQEQLASQGYIKYRNYVIHAIGASASKDQLMLEGVLAADLRKADNLKFLAAQTAIVSFNNRQGQTYATVRMVQPTVTRTGTDDIVQEVTGPWDPELVPSLTKDNPSWYNWDQLQQTLANPEQNRQVRDELVGIQRAIRHSIVCREISRAINTGRPYDKLVSEQPPHDLVIIEAPRAQLTGDEEQVSLSSTLQQPVHVRVLRDGRVQQEALAEWGTIEARWSAQQDISLLRLRLAGSVRSAYRGEKIDETQRRDELTFPPLEIPLDILARADRVGLEDIYASDSDQFSSRIRRRISYLREYTLANLTNKIIAEMHVRVTYGVSCFLMVALGAALGLMFRGGQMISAFALSMVPASVVIMLILMGKQMVRNSQVSSTLGLAIMWTGITILGLASAAVYGHLARK